MICALRILNRVTDNLRGQVSAVTSHNSPATERNGRNGLAVTKSTQSESGLLITPDVTPEVAVPLALSLAFSVSPAQLRHALVFRRTPPL